MISCKIFFQFIVIIFTENLHYSYLFIFYISIRLVFEIAFISEQIAENRSGNLLEIRAQFINQLNVFNYIILQFRLKTVWQISKPYYMTLKTVTM